MLATGAGEDGDAQGRLAVLRICREKGYDRVVGASLTGRRSGLVKSEYLCKE